MLLSKENEEKEDESMTLLTPELVKRAINLALPTVREIARKHTWGPTGVCIAVAGRGLDEPIVRFSSRTVTVPNQWGKDFCEIALQKLTPSHREGLTSNKLVSDFPWLLEPGDSLYERGAAVESPGLTVAVSGIYGEGDEAIAWIVWNIIRMLCLEKVRKLREQKINCLVDNGRRLLNGTKVITTEDAGSDDWTNEGRAKRKWGMRGTVLDHSDSHGLCYLVRHEDGSEAWYEPTELKIL